VRKLKKVGVWSGFVWLFVGWVWVWLWKKAEWENFVFFPRKRKISVSDGNKIEKSGFVRK